MSLPSGSRLGPYEIVSLLGVGGMGEVYRARDAKLNRDVAIKILLPAVANDPDRLARFSREAQMLASLNHPNIAQIYGQEPLEDGGAIALVMELVEGPTLADKIAGLRAQGGQAEGKGPGLPLDEALPIARQICEALEAAHEQNIIHRDLKPANIKVRPDGTVKVLDFGLAKALTPDRDGGGSATAGSMSPTITTPAMTQAGVILGTAAYMSPEQARGKTVDKRADIWAFGAILFEMLTGARAFWGEDITDTIVAVVSREPDWRGLPAPASRVRPLIARCLTKDPKKRMRDIGEARLQIDELATGPSEEVAAPGVAVARGPSLLGRIAPYAAAVLLALVTGLAVWRFTRPVEAPRPLARFFIELPDGMQLSALGRDQVAISPDGTHLAYAANARLYQRALDQLEAVPIPGTETGDAYGRAPFFSPDGQWVGFWQDGQLKKVAVSGGAPVTICASEAIPAGVSWGPNDEILFGAGAGGVMLVPGTGGTAKPLIALKNGERAASPQMIPGGDWVLFAAFSKDASNEQGQAVVQSRSTGERRVLLEGVRDVRYVPSGHLVFGRGNTLLAQPFDTRRLVLSGGPVPVLENVANTGNGAPAMHVGVSSTGTLFYVPGSAGGGTAATRLVQVARDGTRSPLADVAGMAWFPRYSPEGSRVAFGISPSGINLNDASDLWVLELARGARTRVTFTGNNRFYPVWTRDGTRLTFADSTQNTNRIVSALADGSGGLQTLLDKKQRYNPSSWSPDGRTLAYHLGPAGTPTNSRDLWVLHVDGDKQTTTPFVETPFHERGAIFSPDGRWVAYVSDKSGQNDIYARPYPGPGSEVTISVGGGQEPMWAPSGRELFYRHDGKLLAVPIQTTASSLTPGAPARVLDDPYVLDLGGSTGGMANYDVSPDGKRFVMVEEPRAAKSGGAERVKLHVVLNWTEELKQRVPTR